MTATELLREMTPIFRLYVEEFGPTPESDEWPLIESAERFLASRDTHPKDGDVKQAPLVSGAVPKGNAQ